jgi:hypothetical protein
MHAKEHYNFYDAILYISFTRKSSAILQLRALPRDLHNSDVVY